MSSIPRSAGWKIRQSLWLLLAIVPIFNSTAFLYIGLRTSNRGYKLLAAIHGTITVLLAFFITSRQFRYYFEVPFFLALLHYLVILIQAIANAPKYLRLLAQKENRKALSAQLLVENSSDGPTAVYVSEKSDRVPQHSERHSATPVSQPAGTEVLNVNTCSEEELAALPGVGVASAKKAIAHRQQHGDFASVEEFITVLAIKPHIAVGLVGSLTAEPTHSTAHDRKSVVRQLDI